MLFVYDPPQPLPIVDKEARDKRIKAMLRRLYEEDAIKEALQQERLRSGHKSRLPGLSETEGDNQW